MSFLQSSKYPQVYHLQLILAHSYRTSLYGHFVSCEEQQQCIGLEIVAH